MSIGRLLKNDIFKVIVLIIVLFAIWWWPYLSKGHLPLNEFGSGLIWGDWNADRHFLVEQRTIPEWNPNNVLGSNYIGRDPFNNPLSLGNAFKRFFKDPKKEWVFGILFYLIILGLGTYKFLRSLDIDARFAILGALLITMLPKWLDDIYHGPGKFVTAYSVVPWAMLLIRRMFQNKPELLHYLYLGICGAIIFLGSGAWMTMVLAYILGPWYLYNLYKYLRPIQQKRSAVLFNSFGLILALLFFAGLTAYLLFPLLDNLRLSTRSLCSPPVGYGLKDLLGMIFPWNPFMYTRGYYNYPLSGIPILGYDNFRSYFSILLLPILAYVFTNKELRAKLSFFWIWPLAFVILHSQIGNTFLPVLRLFEKLLNAQSSENFMFFGFFFCGNILLMAAFSNIWRTFIGQKAGEHKIPCSNRPVRWLTNFLIGFYCLVLLAWVSGWLITHNFFGNSAIMFFFIKLLGGNHFYGLQLLCYTYFFDVFFIIFLLAFIIRLALLLLFRSGIFWQQKFWPLLLGILMMIDLLLFPKMFYTFQPRIDQSYSAKLAQNSFIKNKVAATERVACFYPTMKSSNKDDLFHAATVKHFPGQKVWDPPKLRALYEKSNPDIYYYQPLFDPCTTFYPVTIGKQIYNYHESLLPEYYFDFDRALNKGAPGGYHRSSWNALWDPYSPLSKVAGLKYIFWYEPLQHKDLVLVEKYPIGNGYIYKNLKAVPKAYLADQLEYIPSRDLLLHRMGAQSFDPGRTVTTEDKSMAQAFAALKDVAAPGKPHSGQMQLLNYGANAISLKVKNSGPAVLVISDLFFPYWKARIDQAPAAIYRVNCVFRGLLLKSGEHLVELSYRNPAFHLGLKISWVTLLMAIFFIGWPLLPRLRKFLDDLPGFLKRSS